MRGQSAVVILVDDDETTPIEGRIGEGPLKKKMKKDKSKKRADVKLVPMKKTHPAMIDLFPISEFDGVPVQVDSPEGFEEFVAPEAYGVSTLKLIV